jgi:hypothetical protein
MSKASEVRFPGFQVVPLKVFGFVGHILESAGLGWL